MNFKLKKLLASFTAAAMIASAGVIVPAAEDTLPSDGLLMDITFDEAGTGSGKFAASKGGEITEHGNIEYTSSYDGTDANKALSISTDSAGNYLELPKGVLNGCDAASFAFWIKPSSRWAFMTTTVNSQDYLNEKYMGMLASSSGFTAERYNNSGTRLSTVTADGSYLDWQYVVTVFEKNALRIYVNGKLAAADTKTVDIKSLMTADASTWIGHANWGDGEGFSGKMDDFRIYGKALSEEEIGALSAKAALMEKNKLIAEQNSIITDTHFYDENGTELFAFDKAAFQKIKADINIKNYTAADTDYTIGFYSVDANGAKQSLAEFPADVISAVSAGEEISVPVEVTTSDIPDGSVKLAAQINFSQRGITHEAVLYGGIKAPVAAPPDSNDTTIGAHDPSIVKFDGDDTYYVYSSHHLIFTSEDLINWTKYDYTNINAKDISPKTYSFISGNYGDTTMNGTYWAPDVIYKAGDDHPYWMYISVSCGLGGRNSAISLMKSDSPLFWADNNADIIDAGVVFATKETDGYKTNAIDANIYTDTDNQQYFIWGSFWGGIQAAKLKDDGFVEGIDYTSASTILNTCRNFGTSVFTQKNGVAGPEGAWMINHGDYRYMFTSYGWLGSNYNTRVARSSVKDTAFSTNMGTQLADAKGTIMGTEQSKGGTTKDKITGYKLIGSYRLGDGSMEIKSTGSNYYVERAGGDAHIYYGPGHNSAITASNGESFYISHTRKDAVEGAAVLQARKMLFTPDGWPVVSPVTYAGEVEQALNLDMLLGTYDLASVGQTKMKGNSINSSGDLVNRNYDLPVLSSKITLNSDGTLADGLGTWTFDGDHTLTLKFDKNGDTSKDEFYKAGDIMTMYALYGYDKDEAKPVIALTGTDQNHITQLAKKNMSNLFSTELSVNTEPIVLSKSKNSNPVLGFDGSGKLTYSGDPSVLVDGDTVYIYAGHDVSTNDQYNIPEYICYSSKNLVDWDWHGSVFKVNKTTVPWASGSDSAWAGQVLKHNGKYYMYYCTWAGGSYDGYQCIGAAVSDSPTGPFTNVSQTPLINGKTMTPENSSKWNDIDPTGWIETDSNGDEHIYLNWGNTENYTCELNDDMVSVKDINGDGKITSDDIKHTTFRNMDGVYTEAPYLYRRMDENGNYTGKYYLFFAKDWREQWAYATTDNIMGGSWDYGSLIMPPTATSNTSHGAIFDFNGKTYFVYHNGALPGGSGHRRVANIQEMKFGSDGSVAAMEELSIGLKGTASIIKTSNGKFIGHDPFTNTLSDADYPIVKGISIADEHKNNDTAWEIVPAKSSELPSDAAEGETIDSCVSIQAVNKPGLYIKADGSSAVLTQDADGKQGKAMTFRTVKGIDGSAGSVSFESVSAPGKFLAVSGGSLKVSAPADLAACSFTVEAINKAQIVNPSVSDGKVDFTLINASSYSAATVYIAEYDADNVLVNVKTKDAEITSDRQEISVDYLQKSADNKLYLMIWGNSGKLEPITDKTIITN